MTPDRADHIAGRLNDRDDEREHREAYEQQRDIDLGHEPGWIPDAEMIAWHAQERAAVEEQCALEAAAERAVIADGWRDMYYGPAA